MRPAPVDAGGEWVVRRGRRARRPLLVVVERDAGRKAPSPERLGAGELCIDQPPLSRPDAGNAVKRAGLAGAPGRRAHRVPGPGPVGRLRWDPPATAAATGPRDAECGVARLIELRQHADHDLRLQPVLDAERGGGIGDTGSGRSRGRGARRLAPALPLEVRVEAGCRLSEHSCRPGPPRWANEPQEVRRGPGGCG